MTSRDVVRARGRRRPARLDRRHRRGTGRDASARAERRPRPHAPAAGSRTRPATPAGSGSRCPGRRTPASSRSRSSCGTRRAASASSSFVTHLVAVAPAADGAPVGEPLNVAWIWKIAADPATNPDGQVRPAFLDVDRAARPPHPPRHGRGPGDRGPADARARVRRRSSPGPSGRRRIRRRRPASTAMRSAARSKQVLTSPYVPIDIPSLEAGGLGDEAALELARGIGGARRRCSTARLDSRTTDVTPLDTAALARLELSQVDRLVVPPGALVAPDEPPQLTPARPFTIESGGRQFATVQTDDGLEDLLGGTAPPALRAANFLAGLAIVAIEAPNQTRGVADRDARALGPGAVAARRALVDGFSDNPLVSPVTLDQLFDHVPPAETDDGPVVRELAPLDAGAADREPGQVPTDPRQPERVRQHRRVRRPGDRRRSPRAADLAHLALARRPRPPAVLGPPRTRSTPGSPRFANLIQTPPTRAHRHADVPEGRPPAELQQRDRPEGARSGSSSTATSSSSPTGAEQILELDAAEQHQELRGRDPGLRDLPAEHLGHHRRRAAPAAARPGTPCGPPWSAGSGSS